MSGHQPPTSQQAKRQKAAGGGRVKVYLHAVTDEQAALLTDSGSTCPLEEISKKTGTDVEFDPHLSPVPGMKILIIRGVTSKIEEVVRLIRQMTGAQDSLSEEAQTFWLQWVEASFPDLDSRAYFLPPVYFNRVPMTRQSVAGQDVMVLDSPNKKASKRRGLVERIGSLLKSSKTREPQNQVVLTSNHPLTTTSGTAEASISQPATVQDSDIRDDAAMKQVLFCLHSLSQKKREVLVGITRLDFRQYLSEPCFAVAAAQLPRASSLPPGLPQNWKQGQFDVLLIHRHYGLVVCNVMSFGDITDKLRMSQEDIDKNIRKKVRDAMSQLDKAEAMLSHLVSDVCPGLRITKTIAVPNLTTDQVQQAIAHDSQLTEDLCDCLGTTDPADIPGLCLCSDQLSDPKTPWDVNKNVFKKFGKWWKRRVAVSGSDSHMTSHVYKTLVARCFHGNAPAGWQVEYFTRPLRSPPAVVREVEQDMRITKYRVVHSYRERDVSDHTDGPPVTRLYHRGLGHSGHRPGDCVTCGREVASFLLSLRVGVTESGTTKSTTITSTSGGTTTPCLQWRDVLVLDWGDISDNPGMVKGLDEAGIPVRVMEDDDIEDVATARSDVVWVTRGHRVRGLERKVVVCVDDPDILWIRSDFSKGRRSKFHQFAFSSPRLELMSRCTSQLVIVSPDPNKLMYL